jgi:hypothetical protein
MQRWHLTLGLSTLAALGLWLAPRLFATPAATVAIPIDPIPEVEAVAVNVPIDTPAGHLQVSMGLDRTAVLVGKSEDRWVTVQVTTSPLRTWVSAPSNGSLVSCLMPRLMRSFSTSTSRTLTLTMSPFL